MYLLISRLGLLIKSTIKWVPIKPLWYLDGKGRPTDDVQRGLGDASTFSLSKKGAGNPGCKVVPPIMKLLELFAPTYPLVN